MKKTKRVESAKKSTGGKRFRRVMMIGVVLVLAWIIMSRQRTRLIITM